MTMRFIPSQWQLWVRRSNITTSPRNYHDATFIRSVGTMAPRVSSKETSSPRANGNSARHISSSRDGADSNGSGNKKLRSQTFFPSVRYSSQLRWNFSSQRIPPMIECRTLDDAIAAAYDNLDILPPCDIAAFWAVVPKLIQKKSEPAFKHRAKHIHHQIDTVLSHTLKKSKFFDSHYLAQTTLGFAKIIKLVGGRGQILPRGSPEQILRNIFINGEERRNNKNVILLSIGKASFYRLRDFDPPQLCDLIYAYGLAKCTLKAKDGSSLYHFLATEAVLKLEFYDFHDLSKILWAFANVEVFVTGSISDLFEYAGDAIHHKHDTLDMFTPQHVSKIVWAYATLGQLHNNVFRKVADHVVALDNLDEFAHQNLSDILWAYATANIIANKAPEKGTFSPPKQVPSKESRLFKKLAYHIVALDNLGEFNQRTLSNVVWAFAAAGESQPELFKKVADHIITLDNLRTFTPQALSNIVWAYATTGGSHPQLFKKISDHIIAIGNVNTIPPKVLPNIVWAYATAGESKPNLFRKLAETALNKENEFTSEVIANFLMAYATNGQIDENLFKLLAPTAAALFVKCTPQNLADIAWAYSVVNVNIPSLFGDNFIDICLKNQDGFTREGLQQLHQWHLWREELGSEISLPPPLQKKCFDAFFSQAFRLSSLQRDVISQLSLIGLRPEEQKLTKRGYRVDALVEVAGNEIGIEIDGPSRFVGRKPKGSMILRRRQVANLEGLALVIVPYWEWNNLGKDPSKKQHYLRNCFVKFELGLN